MSAFLMQAVTDWPDTGDLTCVSPVTRRTWIHSSEAPTEEFDPPLLLAELYGIENIGDGDGTLRFCVCCGSSLTLLFSGELVSGCGIDVFVADVLTASYEHAGDPYTPSPVSFSPELELDQDNPCPVEIRVATNSWSAPNDAHIYVWLDSVEISNEPVGGQTAYLPIL